MVSERRSSVEFQEFGTLAKKLLGGSLRTKGMNDPSDTESDSKSDGEYIQPKMK